tara:strand:- start:311 stop:559 length:249 start_codon:yes stop_codon:yes gene_type:complete
MAHTNYVEIKESETEIVQKVAALIRNKRQGMGVSQMLLSEISGVEQSYISKLELGKKPGYTFGIVAKLFTALKIKFSEIDDL